MANDEPTIHIDYLEQHPDIPEQGPDKCPKCNVEAECGYGMAGGGVGVYIYCPNCGQILSKTQTE